MTNATGSNKDTKAKRGPRPFPVDSFGDSLTLARGIHAHAAGDAMRRLTLFDKLGPKPESNQSRQLIINSNKYGLTTGTVGSEHIAITDEARKYLADDTSPEDRLRIGFSLAIGRSDIFSKLYERLKDKRVPAPDVMRDELGIVGVASDQRDQAGRVFMENIRYLGLVRELSGVERLIPLEQAAEGEKTKAPGPKRVPDEQPPAEENQLPPAARTGSASASHASEPSVHIDIQIHIDASASPQQIDQIFASMGKHLYGRGTAE